MYPLTCHAGYPMPVKAGKFEVWGFQATVRETGSDSQVTLVDDKNITVDNNNTKWGNLLTSTEAAERPTHILEKKGYCIFNNGTLEYMLSEPIKTRKGISVYLTNINPGTLKVFVS